ncbi:MAG: hypothetical protein ACRD5H_08025 [Nitrososphaerales archaeon]
MSNIRSFVAHFIAAILIVCPVILGAAASSNVVANWPAAQTGEAASTTPFESAQYYLKTPNEKKTKQIDGTFVLDSSAKTARFVTKGKTEIEIPYGSITGLLYERAATPRYSAAVFVSPLFLFSKSKKHFLTIQYKNAEGQGQFALIRFDKKNWQPAVAAVEAQTGIKVERVAEK